MSENMAAFLTILALRSATIACVMAAAYLASKGIGGWGWFLFVGVVVSEGHVSTKKDEDKSKEEKT